MIAGGLARRSLAPTFEHPVITFSRESALRAGERCAPARSELGEIKETIKDSCVILRANLHRNCKLSEILPMAGRQNATGT